MAQKQVLTEEDGALAPAAPLFAEVAILGVPQFLTYALPEAIRQHVSIGDEVLIPLGRQQRSGWIVTLLDSAPDSLREVEKEATQSQLSIFEGAAHALAQKQALKEVLQHFPAFLPSQMTLFSWMSEYYGVSLSEILQTAQPRRQESKKITYYHLAPEIHYESVHQELQRRAPMQASVLEELCNAPTPLCVNDFTIASSSVRAALNALEKKNLIVAKQQNLAPQDVSHNSANVQVPSALTEGQERAVTKISKALHSRTFSPFLLLGVTGSGKTEVYIQSIKRALANKGSALLLVPEISLTPQLVDQLSTRLELPLALLHSQVNASERWHYWNGLRDGTYRVAVGARSALFAPIKDLQLIIIDEEHESSYKQSDGFRYHGRDVAVMRAKTESCTLVLGSATPSLETLSNVQRKRYSLLELPARVHARPVPAIEIIDLLRIPLKKMPAPTISPELHNALAETLAAKQQAVILYNKRGFSSYLQCDTCGEAVSCPECSIALTFHKTKHVLLCHYCGYQQAPPDGCGYCRNPATIKVEEEGATLPGSLSHRGAGTERVVEDIATLFPEARLARMDRDTVGAKDAYRTILQTMRDGSADILVGTQMIAKGHDLPGVTLVGIVDADVGLHVPDFRTSERVYQLITQAAGRAGRGEHQGRVLVQTRQAAHPTIVATATGRFLAFARFQLEQREKLRYPPHGRLLRIIISANQQRDAIQVAEQLSARLTTWASTIEHGIQILGPAPAPHQRLRGMYRWHLLIKSQSAKQLSELAHSANIWRKTDFKHVKISVDVDPIEML